jgi:hypothetical protein
MTELIRVLLTILFVFIGVYFGFLSLRVSLGNKLNDSEKLYAAKRSAQYLSLSAASIFIGIEIYRPTVLCVPFLAVFLILFWLEYLIRKGVISFLRK